MKTLSLLNTSWQIPERWEELTPSQAISVLPILIAQKWNALTQLCLVAMLSPKSVREHLIQVPEEQMPDLLACVDWLNNPPKHSPLKYFRIGFTKFWIPTLSVLTSIETAMADNYLQRWAKSGNEDDLDRLVSVLCRPAKWWIRLCPALTRFNTKWNGDRRTRFNGDISVYYSSLMRRVPVEIKLSVVWSYVNIKRQVVTSFGDLFTGGDGSLIDCIYQVAAVHVFGDFETTSRTPYLTLLGYLKSNANAKQHATS